MLKITTFRWHEKHVNYYIIFQFRYKISNRNRNHIIIFKLKVLSKSQVSGRYMFTYGELVSDIKKRQDQATTLPFMELELSDRLGIRNMHTI